LFEDYPISSPKQLYIYQFFFFGNFFIIYFQLGMIRNTLDFKYAAEVWVNHLDAKLIIAILFTVMEILFDLLLVVFQKGLSINIFDISNHDIFAMHNLLVSRILLGLYGWIISPITTAVIVSFYFKDIEAKEANTQNMSQLN